jgi:hypothetical protein
LSALEMEDDRHKTDEVREGRKEERKKERKER